MFATAKSRYTFIVPRPEPSTRYMTSLPDEIKSNIESRKNRDLTVEDVAEVLHNGERPYYSVGQIRARLAQRVSEPPIRARLGELIDADYVEEEQVGRMQLYWWKNPKSSWPVPPDVSVEAVPDEMTISEFFNQKYVKRAAWGVGIIVIGFLFVILGAFGAQYTGESGLLYQMIVFVVGLSFLAAMVAFLLLFSSVYNLLRSDVKIFR